MFTPKPSSVPSASEAIPKGASGSVVPGVADQTLRQLETNVCIIQA